MKQLLSINSEKLILAMNIIKKLDSNIELNNISIIGATFDTDDEISQYSEVKILCDNTQKTKDFYIVLTSDDCLDSPSVHDKFRTFLLNPENGFHFNKIFWKKYQNIDIVILK